MPSFVLCNFSLDCVMGWQEQIQGSFFDPIGKTEKLQIRYYRYITGRTHASMLSHVRLCDAMDCRPRGSSVRGSL